MDWRIDSDYAFCQQLDLSGWAWQFLRRNPEYRQDYADFIVTWQQLETLYGSPPHRDFYRWKQDPRAWRSEAAIADCGTDVCPGENDQVLIECWMGAKWGFRKFPADPALAFPEDIAWREFPLEVGVIESGTVWQAEAAQLAIAFDLALPLPAQLEIARRHLAARRMALHRDGTLPPRNLREGAPQWRRYLRWLDAMAAGNSQATIAGILGAGTSFPLMTSGLLKKYP